MGGIEKREIVQRAFSSSLQLLETFLPHPLILLMLPALDHSPFLCLTREILLNLRENGEEPHEMVSDPCDLGRVLRQLEKRTANVACFADERATVDSDLDGVLSSQRR